MTRQVRGVCGACGKAHPPTIEPCRGDHLVTLSVRLEEETGYDSIPTIEGYAQQTQRGYWKCYVPDCHKTCPSAKALWEHLHFGRHGLSFGQSLNNLIAPDDNLPTCCQTCGHPSIWHGPKGCEFTGPGLYICECSDA